MATIALQAVGSYYGGPIGGAIGAAIGSYIDQKYLFPALFPEDDIQGNRIDSLQLSYSSEGAPMNRCFGSNVKVGATCIWLSDAREAADQQEVGKGGGQEVTMLSFFCDMAWAYADTSILPSGQIDGVEKVFFDGNLVWVEDPNVGTGTQTNLSVSLFFQQIGEDIVNQMQINSPVGGFDLSSFNSGLDATTTNFANAVNNGTFRVLRAVRNGDGSSFMQLDNLNAVVEAAGASVAISQTGLQFDPTLASTVTFYDGSQTTPDATIVGQEANVPAFIHQAYFVMTNFNMSQFGGRPPTSVEVVVRAEVGPVSRADTMRLILNAANRTETTDYDVTDVSGDITGYVIRGAQAPHQALAQLMVAYDILSQDRGGVLTFIDRASLDEVTVDSNDLAAHERSSDVGPRNVRFKDNSFRDLPNSITVTYVDEDNELQNGAQTYRRVTTSTDQSLQMRLDLVLGAAEAQCIARRVLWQATVEGIGMQANLPPSYIKAIESDILKITGDDGVLRDFLARTVDQGEQYLRRYEGVENDAQVVEFLEADCIVEPPTFTNQVIRVPANLNLFIMDTAAFTDAETLRPGFYWAVSPFEETDPFSGGSLFESKDDGGTFEFLSTSPLKATMGYATTTLATVADPNVTDFASSVTIQLYAGSLSTKTLNQVLAGANRAIIGNEIVGFANVTDNANGTWTLDTFIRGLRDTEDQVGTHATGDRFVLLNGPGLLFEDRSLTALNETRDYRGVPAGGLVASYATQVNDLTLQLNTLRPFHPYNVQATIDGSNDWTFTWERRTRAIYNALSGNPLPQLEPVTLYEVDILNGGNVVRTLSSTTETVDYTSAQQVTDFGSNQTTLTVRVYQVSAAVGRSKQEQVTLTP